MGAVILGYVEEAGWALTGEGLTFLDLEDVPDESLADYRRA